MRAAAPTRTRAPRATNAPFVAAVYPLRSSALLNAFWIPLAFQEAALLAIAVPSKLLELAPNGYTAALAVLASAAAFVSMLAPPFAGMLSDSLRRRGGGRKTIIIAGAALDVVSLVLAAHASTTISFGCFFLLATIGANASITAYQALLPDTVPRELWGAVSGMRGAANLLGTVIGLTIAGTTNATVTFDATAIFVGLGALTVYGIRMPRYVESETPSEERARIRDWHDFIVTFVARLFVGFGLSLLMTYVLYFFHDVLHVQSASGSTGLVAGFALVGAILSSLFLGKLSDRFVRKGVVALSGVPMALAAIGFGLFPNERAI